LTLKTFIIPEITFEGRSIKDNRQYHHLTDSFRLRIRLSL